MNDQELEELLVKLTADASSLLSTLKEAQDAVKKTAEVVESHTEKVEAFAGVIEKAFKAVTLGATAAVTASFLGKADQAFYEAELGESRLRFALEANGRSVEHLTEDYKDFASEMQKTTVLEDDHVIKLLKQAEMYGVSGEAAKRAVKNAQGLADVHETTADSFIRMTAMLEQGKVGRLGMLLGMADLEEGTDKVAEAQRRLTIMSQVSGKETELLSGKQKQLNNEIGDLVKKFGEITNVITKPIKVAATDALREMVRIISETPRWVKAATIAVAALVSVMTTLKLAVMAANAAMVLLARTSIASKGMSLGMSLMSSEAVAASKAVTGLKLAIAGLVAFGIAQLMRLASGMGKLVELNEKAREESKATTPAKFTATFEEITKKRLDAAGDDPLKRIKVLDEEILREEKLGKLNEDALARMRKHAETKGGSVLRHIPIIGEAADEDWKTFEARMGMSVKFVEDDKKRLEALRKARREAVEPIKDPEVLKSLRDFTNEMKVQAATFGMTEHEAKLYALEVKGLTFWQLAEARALAKVNEELKKTKELTEAAAKSAGEMVSGGMEAMMEKLKATKDEIKSVTEEMRTPEEVFADRVARLDQLLAAGLGPEVYARAIAKAREELEKATKAAKDATKELEKLDAVEAGSAEDRSRRIAYYESIGLSLPDAERDEKRRAATSNIAPAAGAITEKLLNRIAAAVESLDRKPPTVITPFGVEEN